MTTFITRQPGLPAYDYSGRVECVLYRRRPVRPAIALALAVVLIIASFVIL